MSKYIDASSYSCCSAPGWGDDDRERLAVRYGEHMLRREANIEEIIKTLRYLKRVITLSVPAWKRKHVKETTRHTIITDQMIESKGWDDDPE